MRVSCYIEEGGRTFRMTEGDYNDAQRVLKSHDHDGNWWDFLREATERCLHEWYGGKLTVSGPLYDYYMAWREAMPYGDYKYCEVDTAAQTMKLKWHKEFGGDKEEVTLTFEAVVQGGPSGARQLAATMQQPQW